MSLPNNIPCADLERIFDHGWRQVARVMGHKRRDAYASLDVARNYHISPAALAALLAGDDILIGPETTALILGGDSRDLLGMQRLTGQPVPAAYWPLRPRFLKSRIIKLGQSLDKARGLELMSALKRLPGDPLCWREEVAAKRREGHKQYDAFEQSPPSPRFSGLRRCRSCMRDFRVEGHDAKQVSNTCPSCAASGSNSTRPTFTQVFRAQTVPVLHEGGRIRGRLSVPGLGESEAA